MAYWVYENHVHNKAVVHESSCSACQDGRGVHDTGETPASRWLGPFPVYSSAATAATATGKKNVRDCSRCAPSS